MCCACFVLSLRFTCFATSSTYCFLGYISVPSLRVGNSSRQKWMCLVWLLLESFLCFHTVAARYLQPTLYLGSLFVGVLCERTVPSFESDGQKHWLYSFPPLCLYDSITRPLFVWHRLWTHVGLLNRGHVTFSLEVEILKDDVSPHFWIEAFYRSPSVFVWPTTSSLSCQNWPSFGSGGYAISDCLHCNVAFRASHVECCKCHLPLNLDLVCNNIIKHM